MILGIIIPCASSDDMDEDLQEERLDEFTSILDTLMMEYNIVKIDVVKDYSIINKDIINN